MPLPFVALLLFAADPLGSATALELSYSGRLTPVAAAESSTGQPAAAKGFTVVWLLERPGRPGDAAPEATFAVVNEDSAALPWPARFGVASPGDGGPAIGYRFADRNYVVPLPGIVVPQIETLTAGRDLVVGPRRLTPAGAATVAGRDCLHVEVATTFGRQGTLDVETATGLVVRREETVVLGRGDRFLLTLELSSARPLDASAATKRAGLAARLKELAAAVRDDRREPSADLPAMPREAATALLPALVAAAADTAFAPFADDVGRGLEAQATRAAGLDALAAKTVGSPAPPLELDRLDGTPLEKASLAGKTVVLHFWDYDHEAFEAPYGQVGYLDFLARKRAGDGVAVVGVAVAEPGEAAQAQAAKTAKKLVEFMNLGYPVTLDDGRLLEAFGDPRPLGGRLPLWVVVGPDGVVRLFKPGLYELRPNEGLAELDAAVKAAK